MMRKILGRLLASAGLAIGVCAGAHGQPQTPQENLYMDALQSISDGRQTDASEALIRMIESEPQHAGAWLDLAIIQCELGRAAEAERLFAAIESRFAPPPVILEVIEAQRAKGCNGWQPQTQSTATLGRGTDSNVNQGASNPNFTIGQGALRVDLQLLPENLAKRDSYTVASFDHLRELTPNGTLGFAQVRLAHNDHLSEFDTSSLVGGVEHPWRVSGWNLRGTGLLALHGLGGKLYQVLSQGQMRVTPPLKLPHNLQFSWIAGLSHIEYPTLENFDSNTWELRGLLNYRNGQTDAYATLGYLSDKASGDRPGGDRAGWYTEIQGRRRLSDSIIGELGWTQQTWLSDKPYSPGLIDEIRHQKTQILRGALIFPIDNRQAIQAEVREVRNHDNISVFQYNSRQFQVNWLLQGF